MVHKGMYVERPDLFQQITRCASQNYNDTYTYIALSSSVTHLKQCGSCRMLDHQVPPIQRQGVPPHAPVGRRRGGNGEGFLGCIWRRELALAGSGGDERLSREAKPGRELACDPWEAAWEKRRGEESGPSPHRGVL
jgi:hypothetical protein